MHFIAAQFQPASSSTDGNMYNMMNGVDGSHDSTSMNIRLDDFSEKLPHADLLVRSRHLLIEMSANAAWSAKGNICSSSAYTLQEATPNGQISTKD